MSFEPMPAIQFDDPVRGDMLRTVASEVKNVDHMYVRRVIGTMKATAYFRKATGIAATQIGEMVRIAFMAPIDGTAHFVMINPEILPLTSDLAREMEIEDRIEGCLSTWGYRVWVIRETVIRISFLNEDGQRMVRVFRGALARLVMHEVMHLRGVTILDGARPENIMTEAQYRAMDKKVRTSPRNIQVKGPRAVCEVQTSRPN